MNLTDLTSSIRWWLLSKTFNPEETGRLSNVFSKEVLSSTSRVLTLWIEYIDVHFKDQWGNMDWEHLLILYARSDRKSDPIRLQMILDHMWEQLDKAQPSEISDLSRLWCVMLRKRTLKSIRDVIYALPPSEPEEMYWSCEYAHRALMSDPSGVVWNACHSIQMATNSSYDPLPFFEKLIKANE